MTRDQDFTPIVRVVDDDDAQRQALEFMLICEGWKVCSYASATDFLRMDAPSQSGCLVLDVQMPQMTGLELQKEMIRRGYCLPIIFLTGHGDIDMAVHTLKEGACDFLQKPVDSERFLKAIAKAMNLSVRHRSKELNTQEAHNRFTQLTDREKDVVALVAQGLLNREIAIRLGISERTVEVHRGSACKKLGTKNVADVTAIFSLLHRD